jgi:ABC-type Mn2+/Zn2+ transport system permease subunit
MTCGAAATALFVAHQAIGTKQTRSVARDLALAFFASLFLGSGLLFGLLASGIWF